MPDRIHCGFGYHNYSGSNLPIFGGGVQQGIKNNPTVFDPTKAPVTDTQFTTLISNEENTYAAYKKGGMAQKPAYLTARAALIAGLDSTAIFVDNIANGDKNIIILAGYKPTNATTGNPVKPTAPQTITVTNGVSTGELNAECETFGTNHIYGCIVSPGMPLAAGITISATGQLLIPGGQTNLIILDINTQRKKQFTGLTKGVDYYFYFYVSNAEGVSPLSVAVSKMSL